MSSVRRIESEIGGGGIAFQNPAAKKRAVILPIVKRVEHDTTG
jgi:hypothetical protein